MSSALNLLPLVREEAGCDFAGQAFAIEDRPSHLADRRVTT